MQDNFLLIMYMIFTILCLMAQTIFVNISKSFQKTALGKDLFESVKEKLQLSEEADYFSISYKEPKSQHRVSLYHKLVK